MVVGRWSSTSLSRYSDPHAIPDLLMSSPDTKAMVKSHFETVISTLRLEAQAIIDASTNLSAGEVERAVDLLKTISGKVIVTGIGKSGVIAQKIAQTLTSTGT